MSKGLEALESIKQTIRLKNDGYINLFETLDFLSIEKELKEHEEIDNILNTGGGIWAENGIVSKKLKALEIIKNIEGFVDEEDFFYDSKENKYYFFGYEISKEKFELLKEVLVNEKEA